MPLAFGVAVTGALLRAMTFMIVASPCAVVPATMLLLSAIANVGRHGVPVKSAVIMERLGQVNAVELDKTDNRSLELPAVENFTSAPGIGVTVTVDGAEVAVGASARQLDAARSGLAPALGFRPGNGFGFGLAYCDGEAKRLGDVTCGCHDACRTHHGGDGDEDVLQRLGREVGLDGGIDVGEVRDRRGVHGDECGDASDDERAFVQAATLDRVDSHSSERVENGSI